MLIYSHGIGLAAMLTLGVVLLVVNSARVSESRSLSEMHAERFPTLKSALDATTAEYWIRPTSEALSLDTVRKRFASGLGVQAIFLDYNELDNDIIQLLSNMKSIEALGLNGTNINDDTLAQIAQMRKLRLLRVAHTDITDRSVDSIRKFRSLSYCDISNTKISAGRLSQLLSLPKLKELWIIGIEMTAAESDSIRYVARTKNVILVTESLCDDCDLEELPIPDAF